jgi:hypothetical protein
MKSFKGLTPASYNVILIGIASNATSMLKFGKLSDSKSAFLDLKATIKNAGDAVIPDATGYKTQLVREYIIDGASVNHVSAEAEYLVPVKKSSKKSAEDKVIVSPDLNEAQMAIALNEELSKNERARRLLVQDCSPTRIAEHIGVKYQRVINVRKMMNRKETVTA